MPDQSRGTLFTEADKVTAAMMMHVASAKGWRSVLRQKGGYAELMLLFSPGCVEPAHIVTRLDACTVAVLDASSLVPIGGFPTLIDALGEVSKLAAD